ncbi:MAG: hypothetical protein H8E25_07330 [Planctomycetes bacterium]|nr:hypothetical protein [Planctomycetota bacterium]
MNSTSKRPTEALIAIGSVIALLAMLLVVSKSSADTSMTSAAAPNSGPAKVATSEN